MQLCQTTRAFTKFRTLTINYQLQDNTFITKGKICIIDYAFSRMYNTNRKNNQG